MSKVPANLTQQYLEIERKVINLMLRHLDIVGEMVEQNVTPEFFEDRHRPLIQAIMYTFGLSDGRRLLTDKHYRNLLIEQGGKGDITIAMQVYHECMHGVHYSNSTDDFDFLKKQLIDSYVHRRGIEAMHKFNEDVGKLGYVQATKQYIEDLSAAVNLTESKKSMFMIVDELKDQYTLSLQNKRDSKEEKITCLIPEIDEAMNVGFKPGHTSLYIAATGGHKCLAYYEKCYLEDGSQITAEDLYHRRFGENLSILSYNEQTGSLYYQPVKRVLTNGHKPCLRITTSLGFSVDVTENHPFLQLDGYNEASTLEVGDHVGIARHYKFGNKNVGFDLAFWLGCMYSDGGTSQPLYTFTNQDEILVGMMSDSCKALGGELKLKRMHGEYIDGNYYITALRKIGKDYKLDQCRAPEKSLHPEIFRWDKSCLRDFLRAMFACDGCFSCTQEVKRNESIKTRCSVVYASSSKQLAKDVRDLLMKFGLIAKLDNIFVKYNNEQRESWQVKLRDSGQVRKFVEEVGFYGSKQKFAENSVSQLNVSPNRNNKKFVLCGNRRAKEDGAVSRLAKMRAGINRDSLAELARYLDNDEQLLKLATQDVLWDKIESIQIIGACETFDIAMPTHHNFVTNGFITHNTNLMLNVAINIFKQGHNVLFLPLEMDWEDFITRMACNIAEVSYKSVLNPKQMTDEEYKRIQDAQMWVKSSNKFALLDVDEQISIPVLKREIERRANYFQPDILVIDYLGLLKTQSSYGDRHDLALGELTKSLKFLGKKYGFHVITAAQLGRADIRRLRDQGSQAQLDSTSVKGSQEVSSDAEFIFALTSPPDEEDRLKFHVIKSRYAASGYTKDLRLNANLCSIYSMDSSHQSKSLKDDVLSDNEWLDEPKEKIAQKLEEIKGPEFQGMNPDDLDDIMGL